ncbi:iron-sulfur-binding ferredoxin reductase [Zestomonas carbonaria]|uniref:Naphthalene 1,2-dioxygenase system ferredoxin--NAD(P)(+), reductase component n=1 Tax=Zestomonas carbonaria TaxID=2762745 RepID=A0A7U7EKT2_9GAMM|nr:iron-sulfur-binding ferredoxin reductase [Pseudomonas carbonaria]CAD5105980.1 Naphthalene 1,2-dioxygenase system ferredoxin--NAD(P)(+), reductase component [Pseudomonas carbonaria]
MPELSAAGRRWAVPTGSNLLDSLNAAGLAVPYSCRAGCCHACLVRCVDGEPLDARPEALDATRRAEGWRLSCQCQVVDDLAVEVFDPQRDGLPATVESVDWPSPGVLRLRLVAERPLRYRAGQHLVLWNAEGVARPYSLASLPGEDPWLEFHLDCHHPGAFSDAARRLRPGDPLRLGELRGGALHYDPDWQRRPLWLLAAGTGLAPLWGVLREALRQEHQGDIHLLHLAREPAEHYLAGPLRELVARHANLRVDLREAAELPAALAELRLVSRQTLALLCGHPGSVESFARHLYLAGLPRNQMLADTFLTRRGIA